MSIKAFVSEYLPQVIGTVIAIIFIIFFVSIGTNELKRERVCQGNGGIILTDKNYEDVCVKADSIIKLKDK